MSENKLDRGNLRRQAQRVGSYKSLISRQRNSWKNTTPLTRLNSFEEAPKTDAAQFPSRDVEDEAPGRGVSSPGSSTPSPSSDSSQDFRLNLCSSLKAIQTTPYQSEREREVSSVMTRSATRKYASVGAIHNRVDLASELRVSKRWPRDVSYPTPDPPDDLLQLRDVVTRSFSRVLTFCTTAVVPDTAETRSAEAEENVLWSQSQETEDIIDLSPYLTQESVEEKDGNQITFHLNEDFISHPFVNILALNEDDQEGTLVVHEEGGFETITLHSGETYLVENKYFENSGSESNLTETFGSNLPDDPMIAIHNDHTYAAKPNENFAASENVEVEPIPKPPEVNNEENEFKLENALNDLLLNTAILKCLVCNETPQEIMSQLDMAQSYLYSGDGLA